MEIGADVLPVVMGQILKILRFAVFDHDMLRLDPREMAFKIVSVLLKETGMTAAAGSLRDLEASVVERRKAVSSPDLRVRFRENEN